MMANKVSLFEMQAWMMSLFLKKLDSGVRSNRMEFKAVVRVIKSET